ncbi:class A beta-lactamase-related serine hydrolase [Aequorivita sp. H23M31]|uniref:Class A beta-lactamase-related serine hydrolase n=1 Tax=Aequorivita ciconiae TaxID=2494375 RepID=A0A410G5M0_9FLAO|nr:serine hydrolase domain-containing protein [Aequorivita sp. H23M31]QAA82559.1 class A beta-lactamase-related serine hydrolase [Aequorivita sp. H23M31]
MKNNLFLFLFFGLLATVTFAQDFDSSKLDSYFDALETHNKFMGSVAVSQDAKIIYTRSVGFADVENKIKANENTKYRIGSISKTFTAALVFKGVEAGKIDLNQTIDKFFPTFPKGDKITVQQLLYHRSGIHNFTSEEDYLSWNTSPKSEKEMIDIIIKGGSDFEPDSRAEYSNSNYVLLSIILEKTFKKQYSEILKEFITQPLGLKNTYLGGKIDVKKNESKSYKWMGDWKLEPETDISVPLGAGGIVSTPSDLVKFSDALFAGKVVKEESLKQMENIKEHYGMGLFQFPFGNKQGFGHTGGIDGFTSIFTHFPDGNVSYAMTSNGTNFNNNDISIAVLSAVYNEPYEIPQLNTIELSSEDLDQYLGVYSSSEIPLKITITKENSTLIAQATGQSSFSLEPTEKNKFKFDAAGVVLEFNPSEHTMVLKQGGGVFTFRKE